MVDSSTDRRTDADEGDDLEGGTVNVIVGSENKLYCVHGNLLRSNSDFFEAALKKDWIEGRTREVKLPEEDPKTFKRYVRYIYSGNVACKSTCTTVEYELLADLYAFGERMLDDGFKDAILNALISTVRDDQRVRFPNQQYKKEYPGPLAVRKIYSGTAAGSPARKFIVDLYVVNANANFHHEPCDPDFLLDLAKAYADRRTIKEAERQAFDDKVSGTACTYHHHKEGEPCNAKRRKLN